jgi:hypothetical protein
MWTVHSYSDVPRRLFAQLCVPNVVLSIIFLVETSKVRNINENKDENPIYNRLAAIWLCDSVGLYVCVDIK